MSATADEAIQRVVDAGFVVGSRWRHVDLDKPVTIVGVFAGSTPPDCYCGVTYFPWLRIQEDSRKFWTVYYPHRELVRL